MDPVSLITLALSLAKLGAELEPLAEQLYAAIIKTGGVTQADWDSLHALEAKLRARLATDPI